MIYIIVKNVNVSGTEMSPYFNASIVKIAMNVSKRVEYGKQKKQHRILFVRLHKLTNMKELLQSCLEFMRSPWVERLTRRN